MFDVLKSKLYAPIMEALCDFLGLNKEEATETEVHAALEAMKPIKEQLEAARLDAAKDLQEVKDRLNTLESEQNSLKEQIEAKDARIAELQTQNAQQAESAKKELETVKTQHETEIKTLAGQVSALKAGQVLETEVEQGGHPAANEKAKPGEVIAVKGSALSDLVKDQRKGVFAN